MPLRVACSPFLRYVDDLDALCGGAGKEYSMKKTNEKMQTEWTEIELG